MSESLANAIYIFHCMVILFVVFTPLLTEVPALLILHSMFCFTLMVHWAANSNACSLTVIESQLRGINTSEAFTHQFIKGIYEISECEWNNLIWFITIVVFIISVYKLIHTEKFKEFLQCIKTLENYSITTLLECIRPMFII